MDINGRNSLSISDDGNVFAVGVPQFNSDTGAVYIYTRGDDDWQISKTFDSSVVPGLLAGDRFGFSVAISGDGKTLVVGAPGIDLDATRVDGGALYVFQRSDPTANSGNDWTLQSVAPKLGLASQAGDSLGFFVDVSDNGDVITAPTNNGAYLFRWDNTIGATGNGDWRLEINFHAHINADLLASLGGGPLSENVSDDGKTVALAYPLYNNSTGAILMFKRRDEAFGLYNWVQGNLLLPRTDVTSSDGSYTTSMFGERVEMSGNGDVVVVGAYGVDGPYGIYSGNHTDVGMAYVFRKDYSYPNFWAFWTEFFPVYFPNVSFYSSLYFGQCVSVSDDGNVITVGNPGYSQVLGTEGNLYTYRWTGSSISKQGRTGDWVGSASMLPDYGTDVREFGCGSAISGDGNTLLLEVRTKPMNSSSYSNIGLYIY